MLITMAGKPQFKAVCFDWGNTIEIGTPAIVVALQRLWKQFFPKVRAADILEASQTAWTELVTIVPTRKDLKDMDMFRQKLYARQAEIMARELKVDPDIPDWPWVVNDFFNEEYFRNRSWRIPRVHARVLRKLRAAEVPMAVISNDNDPAQLPKLISDLGLTGFFQTEISSSSFGFCKPHPKIYLAALDHLDLRADEVLFVGDDYHNDYWGPEQVGMFPVLFDPNKLHIKVKGIFRIESLDEILDFFPDIE